MTLPVEICPPGRSDVLVSLRPTNFHVQFVCLFVFYGTLEKKLEVPKYTHLKVRFRVPHTTYSTL